MGIWLILPYKNQAEPMMRSIEFVMKRWLKDAQLVEP